MLKINKEYFDALTRTFYNRYIESFNDDTGISYKEFRSNISDIDIEKLVWLTNNIMKRPGKAGNKDLAKALKYKTYYQKKNLCALAAMFLLKGTE